MHPSTTADAPGPYGPPATVSTPRPGPGRDAESPLDIPSRGWWRIGQRVIGRYLDENLRLVAAGVAFYSLLGLFPAIAALVTTYDLAFDAAQIRGQLGLLAQTADLMH
jgi:membrane protein